MNSTDYTTIYPGTRDQESPNVDLDRLQFAREYCEELSQDDDLESDDCDGYMLNQTGRKKSKRRLLDDDEQPKTTPATIFYDGEHIAIFKKVLKAHGSKNIDELKRIGSLPAHDLETFRMRTLAIGFHLAKNGLAPKYADLGDFARDDEQSNVIVADAPLLDLFWLSCKYPNHVCEKVKYTAVVNKFSIDGALEILRDERKSAGSLTVKNDLNLKIFQQIGLVHFCSHSKVSEFQKLVSRARRQREKTFLAEFDRIGKAPRCNESTAKNCSMIAEAYTLAENSISRTIEVLQMMTGKEYDKGYVSRTISNLNLRVGKAGKGK